MDYHNMGISFSEIACCYNDFFNKYEKRIPPDLIFAVSSGLVAAVASLGLAIMMNKREQQNESSPLNDERPSLFTHRVAITAAHTALFTSIFIASAASFGLSFKYTSDCPNWLQPGLEACYKV